MTTQKLLQLLRPIFSDVAKSKGKLSAIEAVEVIEEYKMQIQNEAINNFLETYGFLYEKKTTEQAKHFCASYSRNTNSRKFPNPKRTLVTCK